MSELNRRRFIQGAGALLGWSALRSGGRAFAAPSGLFSQGTPNLSFGILTDIHLSKSGDSFSGQAMFRKALEWFRDQGVDAVAVCGDMADGGLLAELQAVAQTWSAVFPNDTAPDGRHVERLFIYGNHDYGGTSTGSIRGLGLAEAWQQTFGETYTPVWRKEVCGYTFVGAHWTTGGCKGYDEVGIPEGAAWITQNGASIDPTKPFFYLQHAPPKNTCLGPWHWGRDDGRITTALSNFPNAIAITGHSHASISDERSIWQGAFTAVNAGSLKYTGLEYGDLSPAVRENDGSIANGSGRIMSRIYRDDGHQGMIARVYDDRIVFERRDFEDLGLLGPDWVMPLPMTEPVPLAFAPRTEASVAPEFPAGASLSARLTNVLEVEIPAANREGSPRVFDYAIEIEGSNGGRDERYLFAEGFHRSAGSARANSPTICQVSAAGLTATGTLNVTVTPRNSFGKAGGAISATAAEPVLKFHGRPDHFVQYVEATGTQYIDTEIVGRCNTAMEAHVMWNRVNDASFLSSRIDDGSTRFVLYGAAGRHYMAHRTYTRATDSTAKDSVSGSPKVEWNLEAPDYISSSISTDGTSVTYWMKVNGTTRINQTRTEEGIDTGLNMYLFAQNLGGSPTLHCKVRCFDLKITQDGVLVRDFRPCVKDGRAGLYDEVSGWIFFPQGGELVYPNETPDNYVRWANATGSSYVPVAVRGKSGVKAEMKFRPTGTGLDQYFLAARNSLSTDTRFLLNYLYRKSSSNNCIAIGYKNKWQGRHWTLWTPGKDYTLSSEISSDGTLNGSLDGAAGTMQVQSGAGGALGAFDTGLNLYMFAANMGGNAQDYYTGRFYYTKIWEWDATAENYRIVRDFKPCVKDGNVMFYDEESHTMFKPYPAIPAEGNVGKADFVVTVR